MALYVRTDAPFYRDGVIYPPGTPVEFDKPPAAKAWTLYEEQPKVDPSPAPAPAPGPKVKPGRASDREPI